MRPKTKSIIERWFPLCIAVLIVGANVLFLKYSPSKESLKDLFNATFNLGGIILGFLTASKAILFSIDEKYTIKQLRSAGVYRKLINYFMDTIRWSFVLIVFDIVCLSISWDPPADWHKYVINVWIFIISTTLLSCYRVVSVFSKILANS